MNITTILANLKKLLTRVGPSQKQSQHILALHRYDSHAHINMLLVAKINKFIVDNKIVVWRSCPQDFTALIIPLCAWQGEIIAYLCCADAETAVMAKVIAKRFHLNRLALAEIEAML